MLRRKAAKTPQAMREINLQEYQRSGPIELSSTERIALAEAAKVAIEPAGEADGTYCITPGSTIGAVDVGDLSVLIEPKIGIPQVLSLACYALGAVRFQPQGFDFREERSLPDALAMALYFQVRRAFARGLLHGYRNEEDALYTVRGASGLTTNCGAGLTSLCQWRCSMTSSPPTCGPTGW